MEKSFSINKFNYILSELDIKKGDIVLVNANILDFIIKGKKNIVPEDFINCLKKRVTNKGTLIFPTYSWDFCEKKSFNYKLTKTISGALSNITLQRKDFKRTKNPIFSFTVYGSKKKILCKMNHSNCFSLNSPFGYLIKNKAKHLFINLDYQDAMTFVHVAEQLEKVNYRYMKTFNGIYINETNKVKKKKYKMFVRKKNVKPTIIVKKFDQILNKNKTIKKVFFNKISFSVLDINSTFRLMRKEIRIKSGLIKYV
tara:strand:- start:208 stop:972 length:765 start_codon:yes stop_codon:yes gene_type:complete